MGNIFITLGVSHIHALAAGNRLTVNEATTWKPNSKSANYFYLMSNGYFKTLVFLSLMFLSQESKRGTISFSLFILSDFKAD